MWKYILELVRQLLRVTEDTQENRAEIKAVRQQLDELTAIVQRLAHEIALINEREQHEREKLELRLENQLLRYEQKQLPPARQDDDKKEDDGKQPTRRKK